MQKKKRHLLSADEILKNHIARSCIWKHLYQYILKYHPSNFLNILVWFSISPIFKYEFQSLPSGCVPSSVIFMLEAATYVIVLFSYGLSFLLMSIHLNPPSFVYDILLAFHYPECDTIELLSSYVLVFNSNLVFISDIRTGNL